MRIFDVGMSTIRLYHRKELQKSLRRKIDNEYLSVEETPMGFYIKTFSNKQDFYEYIALKCERKEK